jgi:macrolide transport system ATP-binding/permease protein
MMVFLRKLIWLFRRRTREKDLEEELRFHVEETTEELQLGSAPPDHAELAALRDLGNLSLVREDTRAAWTWSWLEQLGQDCRYALRGMRRNPLFTAMAALSLALGVGANTAIASFLDALLLRALPVPAPHRLAVLNWHNSFEQDTVFHGGSGSVYDDPKFGHTARIFPYPAFEAFQKQQSVFSSLFAHLPTRNLDLQIGGDAEIAAGEFVSGEFFRGLELTPAAGRLLLPDDDRPGAPPVVVLSYGFSGAHFGSAGAAVGQSIVINNVPFVVVGVAPTGFDGVDPSFAAKFFIPVHGNVLVDPTRFARGGGRRYVNPNDYWIELMGRLRPGVSMRQAEAQLATVFHGWVETTAAKNAERAHLPGLHLTDGATGIDTLRRIYSDPFILLSIMVSLILAIACANIANLLLARAAARRREMAVRLGIGAGRARVLRQLLTESLVLSTLGGLLGVLVAIGGVRFLAVTLENNNGAFPLHPGLNGQVLAAAAAISAFTGLLFGFAPALEAARVDVMPSLRGGPTDQPASRPRLLRLSLSPLSLSNVLITVQIALSALLLIGAGLFVRTLRNLQSVELGFSREQILLFKINARQAGHRDPELTMFYRDLQRSLASIPGVRSATVSNSPLVGEGTWASPVSPLGAPALDHPPDGHGSFPRDLNTHILTVGPNFFSTMQIPLLAGREFNERDNPGSPPVAIVNEAWAQANLGDRNPMGQQIVLQTNGIRQQMEIVGVARNARYGDLKGAYPAVVYMAFWQNLYVPPEEATYALRAARSLSKERDPLALASAVREIVRQADSRIPITGLKTQAAMIDQTMTGESMFARLCTGFAILALTIACVGLYGTVAHTVARRTNEIGVRMALGASRHQVVWLAMRQMAVVASIGLPVGVIAASALSRLVESLLFGVKPIDPPTIVIAIGTLLVAAGTAAYIPARRASRIEPIVALRHE